MNTKITKRLSWLTAILAASLVTLAFPCKAAADNDDPPGRVARIRYLQGSVSFEPAGESDWVAAVTNRPMTIGDQIWADAGSRAEIQVGAATIRMNDNTGFSFLNLDDRTVQIQLTDGTLNLRVLRVHPGEVFEVDTPNQAFSVIQPGLYRIQAGSDGASSMVTVRQGRGEVTGGGRTYTIDQGQVGTFTGNGSDSLDGQLASAGDPDDFDNWSQSRDRQYEGSRSARYVSPDVVGYEDLDANGTWSTDPTYGNVWVPTSVQSGWAPYRYGHWVWISPWGWTWVDDAPWGYAPFHYGRWVSMRGRWGWVPGPVNVQPVYAPALVAFIGGPHFGVSVSVGGGGYRGGDVGWFPLGPREVYVPAYTASRGYFDRVNISNTNVSTTTITNVYNNQVTNNTSIANITYVNKTVPGAVTAVPQTAFRSSAPVARAALPVDVKQITAAPVAPRAVVAPTRESLLGATAQTANRMAKPPAAVINRPVVAKTPPPPQPIPFAKQQPELAKHPGQPLSPQQLRPANVATAHPLVKQAPPGEPATLSAARPPANTQPPNVPGSKPGSAPVATAPPTRADRPPSTQQQQAAQQQAAQQQAAQQQEKARQQQSQQQAAQQAEKTRQQQAAQQQAQQQQPEKARQQQGQEQAAQQQAKKTRQQQAAQQQQQAAQPRTDRPPSAQQQAAQQQAEKTRQQQAAQQQAQQQQAEKARQQPAAQQQAAQQQAQQQQAEKARQQQAVQQQAQQQQAEKARQQQAQQQAAQQQAEKTRQQQAAQQQAQQQQAEKARQQQAAQQQAAQQAEKARQQQAAQQQAAQQAERARGQQTAQQQPPPQRPNQLPPAEQPKAQPQRSAAPQNPPMTPAEKASEDQKKKKEQKPPPQPPPQPPQ